MKAYAYNTETMMIIAEIKGDDEKELQFIEAHDLFGALPEIFMFNTEETSEILADLEDKF